MLAASARRAGFSPLVVDAFGDADTRAAAAAIEVFPEAYARGFRVKQLVNALETLTRAASGQPIGLVLGAGFEESPRLVAALAQKFRLLGCGAETIQRCKSPAQFFPLLQRLGIPHPEISLDPPARPDEWVKRRVGGSGGNHILPCAAANARADRRHYFQKRVDGEPVSLSGVVARRDLGLGFSAQWAAARERHPYRFGGAVGPVVLDEDAEARMIDIALALVPELNLVGLVSFDFVLVGGEPLLTEVNPRPGATLDIFDDARGSLLHAHIGACRGEDWVSRLTNAPRPEGARAIAYAYADSGAVEIGDVAWPDWASDRPARGTRIPRFAPIATVHAGAATPTAARELVLHRSQGLAQMLYEGRSGKEI